MRLVMFEAGSRVKRSGLVVVTLVEALKAVVAHAKGVGRPRAGDPGDELGQRGAVALGLEGVGTASDRGRADGVGEAGEPLGAVGHLGTPRELVVRAAKGESALANDL
ncbi:MAG TPA: hypothetical protein VFM06_07515 [Candidatus Limnocylindria bacterium]|nr:hypothetical protein [Candidatus Limnocylindria bacterium]